MSHSHRQQPGLACENCRRRKARCDRLRPTCGLCKDSEISCRYNDRRPQRGPPKGQVMALKNLIADLEKQLGERTKPPPRNENIVPRADPHEHGTTLDSLLLLDSNTALAETVPMTVSMEFDLNDSNSPTSGVTTPTVPSLSSSLNITPLQNTPPGQTSFSHSMLLSTDTRTIGAMNTTRDDMSMVQPFLNTWFDGDTLMSPSMSPTVMPQLWNTKLDSFIEPPMLSELIQADLNELYFERIHPVSPNVHRKKYFAWVKQNQPTMGQLALQYAMWAAAAAVSAQFQSLSGMLSAASRQILEQMNIDRSRNDKETGIEHIQAWLLISHRELLCSHEHQAMMTAGRAIRMVQLAHLHDIDALNTSYISSSEGSMNNQEFIDTEERRRTLWLAYCFDRFCLIHGDCPPSLQEDSIRTRLPTPEENFRSGQPIHMEFLSEALTRNDQISLPPFARCVVLNSLFAQCILQKRNFTCGAVPMSNDTHKLWSKYTWLALALEKGKTHLLPQTSSTTEFSADAMTHFTIALVTCAATTAYQAMARSADWTEHEDLNEISPYKEQAVKAVNELADFVEASFRSMNCFKAHPFLPAVLYRSVMFLVDVSNSSTSVTCMGYNRTDQIKTIVGALRSLALANNLSRSLLRKIEEDPSYVMTMENCL